MQDGKHYSKRNRRRKCQGPSSSSNKILKDKNEMVRDLYSTERVEKKQEQDRKAHPLKIIFWNVQNRNKILRSKGHLR